MRDSSSFYDSAPHVYFLGMYGSNVVKIGVAQDVNARKRDIQGSNPFGLYVAAVLPYAGYETEHLLHQEYAGYRLRGEWFHVIPEMIEYLDAYPDAWLGWRHTRPYSIGPYLPQSTRQYGKIGPNSFGYFEPGIGNLRFAAVVRPPVIAQPPADVQRPSTAPGKPKPVVRDIRWMEKRRQGWYCVKDVPRRLRKALDKKRLIQSLETRDYHVALSRRDAVLLDFNQRIERAQYAAQSIISSRRFSRKSPRR